MSTLTTRLDTEGSEIELVDLRDHLHDAIAKQLAFFAHAADLGARAARFRQACARRVELARQSRGFVHRLRAFRAEGVDHRDKLFDFFFETVNRLKVHSRTGSYHRDHPVGT